MQIARYCKVQTLKVNKKDKVLILCDEKLNNALEPAEIDDQLLMQNLVSGAIITGKLWPLIIDKSTYPLASKRSLAFMQQVSRDPSILTSLNEQEALYFCVGVRDLWLADSRGWLDQSEKQVLNNILDILDDDFVPSAEFQALPFSFCPSKNRRILKYIKDLEELSDIDQSLLQSVAQLAQKSIPKLPSNRPKKATKEEDDEMSEKQSDDNKNKDSNTLLYAVWVDGRDLSYHNFECILPLDRALHLGDQESMAFTMSPLENLSEMMDIYKTTIGGSSLDLLLQLDQLGLYQKPSNSSTRGGERFIFSSEKLSSALTEAFRAMEKDSADLDCKRFTAVNHVFRCNRFAPGDAKFEAHMDTPYYDPAKGQVSKFTMIIYLSSGSGSPVMKVWDNSDENSEKNSTFELTKVKQFDCVIFDQQYLHEGNPFVKTNKVFLRTELIFNYWKLNHTPEVGKLFNSAVYMTLQSTFQPALSRYAHELYERVNTLHWGLTDDTSAPPLVLQKRWRGSFVFATNGCDYWFPYVHEPGSVNGSTPHDYLKEIAVIAILDYFNGRSRDEGAPSNSNIFTAFGLQCISKVISDPNNPATQTSAFILSNLWSKVKKLQNISNSILGPIDFKAIKKRYMAGYEKDDTNWQELLEEGLFEVKSSTLVLFNQEYQIDKEKILIENDKIMIGFGAEPLFCNFACK